LGSPAETAPFVGFENYAYAFADERFWGATLNTLLYVLITVPGAVVVGLGLALLANLPFRVKWPVRLGLLLPWALPLVFAGLIFRWFFEYRQGIVNDIVVTLGFEPLQWLSRPGLAFFAICLAIVWKTSSFVALVLLAGLQTIPKELYEAAEVDGATRWQRFWRITLPLLRPAIVVALIFRTITAIQTFDIPYAMTGGGPGDSTETLAMYIHKTTIDFLDSATARRSRCSCSRSAPSRPRSICATRAAARTRHDSAAPAHGVDRGADRRRQRLPARALDPVHLAQDRGRADALPDHLLAAGSDARQLHARLRRPAAAAVHVEQPRRRHAVDRDLRRRLGARGLCADAAAVCPIAT
jgi:multiple sugar transport system permease protein